MVLYERKHAEKHGKQKKNENKYYIKNNHESWKTLLHIKWKVCYIKSVFEDS